VTGRKWDDCKNPLTMLEYLGNGVGERKLRLFACACSRSLWQLLVHAAHRSAIEIAERFADGNASVADLRVARRKAYRSGGKGVWADLHRRYASRSAFETTRGGAYAAAHSASDSSAPHLFGHGDDREQTKLLREIFGNPFRPVTFDPAWRTSTAVALAAQMYESRDFGAMPILADALQDAGCENANILDHCRGSGPHVRGCWVVDLVLGKE
jgi:hypothetical protein